MKKRLWSETEIAAIKGGFSVQLDTRPVRTPATALLVLPTRALAEMVAAEWRAQGERIDPASMPATRMANAAIDKVTPQFDEVAAAVATYGDSDLLCYRATAPVELVERQVNKWDPLLDWAAEVLGARLKPVYGVMHVPQDEADLAKLTSQVRQFTPFELAAFHDLVAISGSLVIGFAAAKGLLNLEELWSCACLDELWQEQVWGRDDDAFTLRQRKMQDFFEAARFFGCCRQARLG